MYNIRKNNDPIFRKLSDGRTDEQTDGQAGRQTDESDVIGRRPTNIEHPINWNFIFILLCDASKGSMKPFKALVKPSGAPQRSLKIKIWVNIFSSSGIRTERANNKPTEQRKSLNKLENDLPTLKSVTEKNERPAIHAEAKVLRQWIVLHTWVSGNVCSVDRHRGIDQLLFINESLCIDYKLCVKCKTNGFGYCMDC